MKIKPKAKAKLHQIVIWNTTRVQYCLFLVVLIKDIYNWKKEHNDYTEPWKKNLNQNDRLKNNTIRLNQILRHYYGQFHHFVLIIVTRGVYFVAIPPPLGEGNNFRSSRYLGKTFKIDQLKQRKSKITLKKGRKIKRKGSKRT